MSQKIKNHTTMKFRVLFLLTIISLISLEANAQRGVRIGYIDTEYILQNVPEYQEASTQLDKKVLQWKSEIEKKLSVIEQKKKELENESVLLTRELYDERMEDISFEEADILEYQQNRFGPNGDLMIQKRQLIKPIQDQIFAAVQDIAETGKYDFIFDKSADVVMLYSAERYDVSERVLMTITRTSKRSQAKSKKERKELENEEVVPVVNNELDERKKALEAKKATRQEQLATKRAEREAVLEAQRVIREEAREAKRQEAVARRQKAVDARNGKTSEVEVVEEKTKETVKDTTATKKKALKVDSTKEKAIVKKDSTKTDSKKTKTPAELFEEKRQKKLKEREARTEALKARKQKIIDDRKKARDEREKQTKKNDSIAKAKKEGENN
tara:strand:- start:8807 stop:9964 length:1158 start_codon:yes stop_codon:yes gene_type:complete